MSIFLIGRFLVFIKFSRILWSLGGFRPDWIAEDIKLNEIGQSQKHKLPLILLQWCHIWNSLRGVLGCSHRSEERNREWDPIIPSEDLHPPTFGGCSLAKWQHSEIWISDLREFQTGTFGFWRYFIIYYHKTHVNLREKIKSHAHRHWCVLV